MKELVARTAQDNQIGRPFVAQSFVGVMVDFERRRGRADAALVAALGQRLSPALLPPFGFEIVVIGERRPCPLPLACGANSQLTGQHGLTGGAVLGVKRLAANVTGATNWLPAYSYRWQLDCCHAYLYLPIRSFLAAPERLPRIANFAYRLTR